MKRIAEERFPKGGAVTRAFDHYHVTQLDIQGFLSLGMRIADQFYRDAWEQASAQPASDDAPDLPDAALRLTDNVWPHDYHWMFLSAVLKDAVTAFEVYVESAASEVLGWHGLAFKVPPLRPSPPWHELTTFYQTYLGADICPTDVERIRSLRHILVHQRGDLRTEAQRDMFARTGEEWAHRIDITAESVYDMLQVLYGHAWDVDEAAFRFSWGHQRVPELLKMAVPAGTHSKDSDANVPAPTAQGAPT